MTAAYAPTTTSGAALAQWLIALILICAVLFAAYAWAAVRTAAEKRHAAILGAYTEPAPRPKPRVPAAQPVTCWRAPEPGGRHAAGITRQINRVSLTRARHAMRGATR